MSTDLAVVGLGRMFYGEALQLQREAAEARINGVIPHDMLLLVEHPPVVTTGRTTDENHLIASQEALEKRGVEFYDVERGGDVTFHGPGQLVGYTIYNLEEHKRDLHWFLRQIEEALILTLASFGVGGRREEGLTGVWVDNRKIASIGIHVRKWVTWHGFALNVLTDLSFFDLIIPCGIQNVDMTNIKKEMGLGMPPDLWSRATDETMLGFCEAFGQRPQALDVEELRERVTGSP